VVGITEQPLNSDRVLQKMSSPRAGAVVFFLGITREFTDSRQTAWLEYDCYRAMAEQKLAELEQAARARWPVVDCTLLHRVGRVELGEASVLVAVSTPHRQDAFQAAEWLMDTIKQEVPIWKKEHWTDGSSQWVHPGALPGPAPS
jgi:molybdopterin synthase catalytic subunit